MRQHEAMSADPAHELDALVDALLHEKPWEHPGAFYGVELDKTKTGPKLLALDKTVQAAALHRFLEHRSKCIAEPRPQAFSGQQFANRPG